MATLEWFGFLKYLILFLTLPQLNVEGKQNLVNLNEDNWRDMLEGEWMVEFYAPWCPACKSLQRVWNDFSNANTMLKIKVGQVDVTTSPGLSGRFMVTALPTIYHVIKGEFRQYKGSRDKEALISFIKDKKWTSIEPIPSWQSPSSFLRSVLSWFFKLSTVLRSFHNYLLEEYGLPAWSCYLIFAVLTIIIGTFLGLILVCIIDCINPPKSLAAKSKISGKEEIEELDEVDDIIDDNVELLKKNDGEGENRNEQEDDQNDDQNDNEIDEKQEENSDQSKNVRKRKPRKAM
ncbi:thioredoxin domain-containing protein 1 precursor, putative [Pediculus humanus corporis]|uniref:Thioredoxin domain-containing protein 1, putative n=1 Tax=Pediculus humanus subsp. corporis TaxID=121224 RepID=E0VDE1_PEDHC|nr:thioredoxin domain-containing protein 1 precursor, putative [Pediculus humanus corporis]EEB11397.1 thioredoxin domain-containing protein 1 precursor, putative [Pediculus humanus corporis]